MNKKPIVLVIMDGVGRGDGGSGDAVKVANTPNLDKLFAERPYTWLKAHGSAVGLPSDDDMGNSEVGHNALGCGQVYSQGAKLVEESIASGSLFESETWKKLVANCVDNGKAFHFLGLLSDGNVHSNIGHLFALLRKAKEAGVKSAYCHILLDGRDVPATSALEYVGALEDVLAELNGGEYTYKIASGGGRMTITMDRYQANWAMVEAGWKTHVLGEGRCFATAKDAIETYRAETGCIDQDLPAFVIAENGEPVGKIANGDSVVLYNFRGDRAQEISLAFDRKDFTAFDRPGYEGVQFAGMLQYDGDLNIPENYLVQPPVITNTLTEVLCKHGIREYALSETQKYGHVTYFWNGNRSGKVDEALETYVEIPSDVCPFEEKPAMKAVEITDAMVEAMASKQYDFLRCNFPNGDMVGHTGVMEAVVTAMEYVDAGLGRILEAADKYGYTVLITADHGNADQMTETKKGKTSVRTAHSLNPVPFIVYDNDNDWQLKDGAYGLSNVAPTVVKMMGIEAPECWDASII
ncbi:MAG: 2,3-bisphosphoglycerate-independent phosphoglycerate mutase [Oscillospiraceae bacterium]|nr:2,3-bisphosphoglycerate-independent phosphoglycerate mutase [Oscillospiraceae bacterium]